MILIRELEEHDTGPLTRADISDEDIVVWMLRYAHRDYTVSYSKSTIDFNPYAYGPMCIRILHATPVLETIHDLVMAFHDVILSNEPVSIYYRHKLIYQQ